LFRTCLLVNCYSRPIIVRALTRQAQALRSLDRNDEATKIEQHIKTIQAAAMPKTDGGDARLWAFTIANQSSES